MDRRSHEEVKMKKIYQKIKTLLRRIFWKKNSIHYISAGISLPEKLTEEQEEEMLKKLRAGDEKVREILIERNLRLVVYIAQKFEKTGVSSDDLTSIGTIGLIKAMRSFDPEKNIKIATYASRCIENEILMYLRKITKTRNDVSLDSALNTDADGNELLLQDVLGTETDALFKTYENLVEKDELKKAIEALLPREKTIMEMRYGIGKNSEEMTQKEVAEKLEISQSYISRLEKKILDKLKIEMEKMDKVDA